MDRAPAAQAGPPFDDRDRDPAGPVGGDDGDRAGSRPRATRLRSGAPQAAADSDVARRQASRPPAPSRVDPVHGQARPAPCPPRALAHADPEAVDEQVPGG